MAGASQMAGSIDATVTFLKKRDGIDKVRVAARTW